MEFNMSTKLEKIIKKYNTFIKYIGVAILSFLIDIALFTLFNFLLLNKIIISTILARIISSFINFLLNHNQVFKSKENKKNTIVKYYLLVIIQMLISAFVVNKLYELINIIKDVFKLG